MKRYYVKPEMEIEGMLTEEFIAVSLTPEGSEGDGGSDVVIGDPTDPDWGSDFSRLLDF